MRNPEFATVLLIGVTLLGAGSKSAGGQTSPAPTASASAPLRLTVLNEVGVTAPGNGFTRCDMGRISPIIATHVHHTFTLKNETGQTIPIRKVSGSCGCETILLSKAGATVKECVLAPGEQAELDVRIRLAGQHSGDLEKFVWAYGEDSNKPLATIRIDFHLDEVMTFSPTFLRFGDVPVGATRTLPLTISADKAMLGVSGLPALASSNPNVSVTPTGPPETLAQDGRPWTRQRYEVVLSRKAPPGFLTGALQWQTASLSPSDSGRSSHAEQSSSSDGKSSNVGSAGPNTPATSNSSAEAREWLSLRSIAFSGNIAGGLVVTPRTLLFGSVAAGQSATRTLVLSSSEPASLEKVTAVSGSPWITVRLAATEPTGTGAARRRLDVTLSSKSPVGALETQITLAGANGEKNVVTVIAEITK